jgi:hypothetical protein
MLLSINADISINFHQILNARFWIAYFELNIILTGGVRLDRVEKKNVEEN